MAGSTNKSSFLHEKLFCVSSLCLDILTSLWLLIIDLFGQIIQIQANNLVHTDYRQKKLWGFWESSHYSALLWPYQSLSGLIRWVFWEYFHISHWNKRILNGLFVLSLYTMLTVNNATTGQRQQIKHSKLHIFAHLMIKNVEHQVEWVYLRQNQVKIHKLLSLSINLSHKFGPHTAQSMCNWNPCVPCDIWSVEGIWRIYPDL